MADVIDYKIYGNDLQLVEIELDPGEGVQAEVGTMAYMEDGIEMQTALGGGMFAGFKRMLTGGRVSLSAPLPMAGDAKPEWGLLRPLRVKLFP